MDRNEKCPATPGQADDEAAEPQSPCRKNPAPAREFNLDEVLPPRSVGGWPEGLSLRREDMYEDRA